MDRNMDIHMDMNMEINMDMDMDMVMEMDINKDTEYKRSEFILAETLFQIWISDIRYL
jgi:hypothetical protein